MSPNKTGFQMSGNRCHGTTHPTINIWDWYCEMDNCFQQFMGCTECTAPHCLLYRVRRSTMNFSFLVFIGNILTSACLCRKNTCWCWAVKKFKILIKPPMSNISRVSIVSWFECDFTKLHVYNFQWIPSSLQNVLQCDYIIKCHCEMVQEKQTIHK